uniref:PHD finger protein 7-like isoform X2 n=2 Tax=Myxine glutinosa TaxID=7769 RepID=UPI00358DEA53
MSNNRKRKALDDPVCILCGLSEDDEFKYGEMMMDAESEIAAHYYCLILSSGLWQKAKENEGLIGFRPEDIIKEVSRAYRLTCSFCKERGASIGCDIKSCRKIFHLPCALKNSCLLQFYGNYPSYCEQHRPQQAVGNSTVLNEAQQCIMCFDDIVPEATFCNLCTPCCFHWFHRHCLQKLALNFGLYFFRCPACNNKVDFQNEMLCMGIHIPQRDASWELEENAYEDLLQQYEHCDLEHCLCTHGRNFGSSKGRWKLVRCHCCGSAGAHVACARLRRKNDDWCCNDCQLFTPNQRKSTAIPKNSTPDEKSTQENEQTPRQTLDQQQVAEMNGCSTTDSETQEHVEIDDDLHWNRYRLRERRKD